MDIKIPEFTIPLPNWDTVSHHTGVAIFVVFGLLALFCLFKMFRIGSQADEAAKGSSTVYGAGVAHLGGALISFIAFLGALVCGLISALAYVLTF